MNKTKIEWVKNPDGTQGYTLNSKTGCLNHTPEGLCFGGLFPCYAFGLANGRLRSRYIENLNLAQPIPHDRFPNGLAYGDPFYPRFWPEKLDQIRARKKPAGIFLDDMSDWMGDYWPEELTRQELQVMRDCPQHRIYTLTKQPQNLIKFQFPDNCWVGVTATSARYFAEACGYLRDVEARIKYLSIEPYLGEIIGSEMDIMLMKMAGIKQVIIGAQTKPYKPPKIEWVEEIVQACDKAGIPVFLKDNLKPLLQQSKHNLYSFPEWAGTQFAVTGDHQLTLFLTKL